MTATEVKGMDPRNRYNGPQKVAGGGLGDMVEVLVERDAGQRERHGPESVL